MSKIKPNIVRGGQSIDLGNNMFLMQGRPHSRGGIDIGKNLEVEGGEVMQYKPNEVRVFSKEPILNGVSPAQYVLGGANPNDVFNAQEYWKRVNRVSDDGKKYLTGGKIDKRSWTTVLNKRKEDEFLKWYKNISSILNLDSNPDNPLHAYDYRGYWLENRNKDIDYTKSDFHFPDKYKKPTHPTFSIESQYANKKYGINPKSVGYWNGDEFVPGVFNDIMNAPMLNTENVIKNKKRNLKTDKNWEDALLDFQTAFENFSSKAYVSPENDGTYTIGYGTKYIYDDNGKSRKVNENDKLTKEEALEQRRRYIKYSIEPNLKHWGLNNVDKYPDWLKFQLYDNVYNNRNFRNSKYLSLLKEYDNSGGYKKSDYNYDDIINESDFSVKHRRNDGKPSSLAIRGVMRQQPYNINFDDLNNVLIRDKQDSLYNVYNTLNYKLGGRINKPTNMDFNYIIGKNNIYKLGGRKKAPLGIDILNSQNLHRNAEVFDGVPAIVIDEQVVRPDVNIEQQRLLNEASQIINNSIQASVGRDNATLNRINQIEGINGPITIDGRRGTIGPNGTINLENRYTLAGDNRGIGYKSTRQQNRLLAKAKVKNAVDNIKQGIKDNSSELLSTGINLAGNLAGSLINLNAINKMKYYDIIPLRANKLKTNININPQLDTLREQLARFENDTRNNTSSSKTALARRQSARARTAQAINQLFGTKENLQTELINRDRLNQQQVGNMNVQMRNRWRAGKSQFDNQIRNMRAENAIAGINNAIAAFNGENGYFNTRDKKFNEQANRALYALTAPNAVDAITSKNAEKLINTFVEPRFRKRMRRSLGIED